MSTYKIVYLVWLAWLFCFIWLNSNSKIQISYNIAFNRPKFHYKTHIKGIHLRVWTWWNKIYQRKLRHILVWPGMGTYPFSDILEGQEEFIRLNCPFSNCYITGNKTYFKDIRQFDAIIFIGKEMSKFYLPRNRSYHQKYIFYSMESSPNFPVEDKEFDNFFNWTATYRLDSEILMPYILIKDKAGKTVGPKIDMTWVPEVQSDELVSDIDLKHKSRAAAIFYSHCRSLSDREAVISELTAQLKQFGLTVDTFGSCGNHRCSRSRTDKCEKLLNEEYFFYLSFENSIDMDYVTEKVLRPLKLNVVPIVYGGAYYNRFLPPRSYLDAAEMSTWKLARTMVDLITNSTKYLQYFWWKKYYTYHDPTLKENICNICEKMNDRNLWKGNKTYEKFRKWWNINGYD